MFVIVDDDVVRSRSIIKTVKNSDRAANKKVYHCRYQNCIDVVFEDALKECVPQIIFIVECETTDFDALQMISYITDKASSHKNLDIYIMAIGHVSTQAEAMFHVGAHFFIKRYDVPVYFRHR